MADLSDRAGDKTAKAKSARESRAAGARLVICAHGARGGAVATQRHAEAIADRNLFDGVSACCLRGAPSLEDVLAARPGGQVRLLANLMGDGGTMEVLRRRAAAAARRHHIALTLTAPVGLAGAATDMIADLARAACARQGWTASEATLLLAAHGSGGDQRVGEAARGHVDELRRRGTFGAVHAAFLEESPRVAETFEALAGRPIVCVGWFAEAGAHAGDDIAALLPLAGPRIVYLGAVGTAPCFADLLLRHALSVAA